MTSHGHYIVPLRSFGEPIGVMFLYTAPYPLAESHRLETLQAVGDSMALAIVNDRIEQRLLETSAAAKSASMAKSEFLANMSHEIRTPLNGILGFTEMLRRERDSIDEEERAQWIEIIHTSGTHLLQLINNILDLSKVEAGQLDIEKIECGPVELLTDLMSVLRISAREKSISLDLLCQGAQPRTVLTDPTRLQQILTNLVGNAIKFTERGGVTVRSCVDRDDRGQASLVVDVIDTGDGIPSDKIETIFNPFTQADNSITRRFGGTGLGLPISRSLAEALGGTLTAWSLPGRGSTFTLTIPIGPFDKVELVEGDHAEAVRSPRTNKARAGDDESQLRGNVLLVDDGETNRRLIRQILKRAGAGVKTAENGVQALDIAAAEPFDLILMDMQMPIMDGYSASRAIRDRGITTPIIALTASAMKGDRERCLEAGCNDYLTKPVDIRELISTAAKWMRRVPSAGPDTATHHPEPEATVSSLPLDDPELMEIVVDYIDHLTEQVEQVENAHSKEDFGTLARLAHALSGSGGMVGFNELTRLAADLERSALKKHAEDAGRLTHDLKLEALRIQRGIEQIGPHTDPHRTPSH